MLLFNLTQTGISGFNLKKSFFTPHPYVKLKILASDEAGRLAHHQQVHSTKNQDSTLNPVWSEQVFHEQCLYFLMANLF